MWRVDLDKYEDNLHWINNITNSQGQTKGEIRAREFNRMCRIPQSPTPRAKGDCYTAGGRRPPAWTACPEPVEGASPPTPSTDRQTTSPPQTPQPETVPRLRRRSSPHCPSTSPASENPPALPAARPRR